MLSYNVKISAHKLFSSFFFFFEKSLRRFVLFESLKILQAVFFFLILIIILLHWMLSKHATIYSTFLNGRRFLTFGFSTQWAHSANGISDRRKKFLHCVLLAVLSRARLSVCTNGATQSDGRRISSALHINPATNSVWFMHNAMNCIAH